MTKRLPLHAFRGVLTILVLLAAMVSGSARGEWISLGGPEGTPPDVRLLESNGDRIVVEYTLAGFHAEPVAIDGNTWYRILLPGATNLLEEGLPELPHLCPSLIVPDAARMEARVLEADVDELAGLPVVPSKGNLLRTVDPSSVPYRFDPIYATDDWFPGHLASAGEPYILRDYRGQVLEALPFQARGSDGSLRVARRLVVELRATGADSRNTIERAAPPAAVAQDFIEIYSHRFLNFGFDRYVPVGEQGSMLVIVYDAFRDAMVPFVEWKNQQGIPTEMVNVSAIGNNATAIKAYIQNLYNAGGLAHVLLVGDAAEVATPTAAGGSSDPSYSLLAGTDRYPEIFVGRFSAQTIAHVETQVERTLAYEKTPMDGAPWYHRGTGIASNQGPGDDGEYDNQHMDVIRGKLLPYGYSHVDQIYDPTGTAGQVSTALNQGRSIVNYTGHGSTTSWSSTGFSNTHVNALTNHWMLPFIVSVACVNGQFNGYTCFAEAWMRATNNGQPTGAIGTYMSSINQSWNPPMCGQDEVIDLLVQNRMFTLGGLLYNGSCQMIDEYGASGGGDMFLTWHIFGDPSLLVRTRTPSPMIVQHNGALMIGETEYAVTVAGVANARCALYGNGILYGVAYTNAFGSASIVLDPPPAEPVELTLTVTASNRTPAIDPVMVLPPEGPYLVYASATADDGDGGDGDGVCDAGEAVALTVTLRNVGVEPATGITGTLSSEDALVEILSAAQTWPDIPPGGHGESLGGFDVVFAPHAPDGHPVSFRLAIESAEGDYVRNFTVMICAASLAYMAHDVNDDPPHGNGTGWIGAGETVEISLLLANQGQANADNVVANLIPDNPFVLVVQGEAGCETIPGNGEGVMSAFRIRIDEACPSPTILVLRADLAAEFGYAGSLEFPIAIGGFADDGETNLGWTLGAPGDNATSGHWILADPVGTVYNGNIVQPEDDHTPAPGVRCFVTGNGTPGGAAGEADVDEGKTTLLTPIFDLGRVSEATVSYWLWYTNDRGNNPGQDWWDVEVTADGATWVSLEHSQQSTNAWVERSFALHEHITLSNRVQMRFIARDDPPGALVEALIDDFVLRVTEPLVDVRDGIVASAWNLGRMAPNPVRGSSSIRFQVPVRATVDLRLYDVSGRLVRTLYNGPTAPGDHQVAWDGRNNSGRPVGSGVYFLRMQAPGFMQVRQVTIIE